MHAQLFELMSTHKFVINNAHFRYKRNFDDLLCRIQQKLGTSEHVFLRGDFAEPYKSWLCKLASKADSQFKVHEMRNSAASLKIGYNFETVSLDIIASNLPHRGEIPPPR